MYIFEVCRELHVIYFGFNFDTTGKSTAWRTAINNFARKKICSYLFNKEEETSNVCLHSEQFSAS